MGVPSESVFVSDIKIGDSIGSTVETALYGKFASLSQQQSKEAVLVIGLSATVDTASLWLYVIAHKEVWGIPILKGVKPWDKCLRDSALMTRMHDSALDNAPVCMPASA